METGERTLAFRIKEKRTLVQDMNNRGETEPNIH